jgi:hypothetical protein
MIILTRPQRVWVKKHPVIIFLIKLIILIIFSVISALLYKPQMMTFCPKSGCDYLQPVVKAVKMVPTVSPKPPQVPLVGKASYYSVSGCLGCNEQLLMANGEVLDDTRPTVAYNHLPLNTKVKITNHANGKTIVVPVTDRGGFERHGKIADLSLATKNALECKDVCNITILKVR